MIKKINANNAGRIILLFFCASMFLPLALTGCALFGAPKKIAVKIAKNFKYSVKTVNYRGKNSWWKNFNDATLDGLVDKALKNNLNYLIAVKNIQVAKTYVSQNESGLFPTVNFSFGSARNKLPGYETSLFSGGSSKSSSVIYNLNQAGLNASYELDVWNQVNNAVKQAKANVSVSKEDAGVVELTLISNVAQAYFQFKALEESIKNLKKQYLAQKEIFREIFRGNKLKYSALYF